MNIRKTDSICGYPAVTLRDALKQLVLIEWTDDRLKALLGIDEARSDQLCRALLADGYIEPSPMDGRYRLTGEGYRLAHATAARPIRRKTADRILEEFLERVETVNRDPELLYGIREVWVFGSYLGEDDEVGDVDVAVTFVRRISDRSRFEELRRQRVARAKEAGRTFATVLDELYWARHEVELLLKNRRRSIGLHDLDQHRALLQGQPHRVLYADGRRVER